MLRPQQQAALKRDFVSPAGGHATWGVTSLGWNSWPPWSGPPLQVEAAAGGGGGWLHLPGSCRNFEPQFAYAESDAL